jgi:hypothetical protein
MRIFVTWELGGNFGYLSILVLAVTKAFHESARER